jgi:hypothetical protein
MDAIVTKNRWKTKIDDLVDNNVACEVDDLHVERNIVNVVGSIYIII